MKITLTDFDGQNWYVESDQHIAVKACPNCGKPMEVQVTSPQPEITYIVFHNEKNEILGIFDSEAFPMIPRVCHFCKYEEKHGRKSSQEDS